MGTSQTVFIQQKVCMIQLCVCVCVCVCVFYCSAGSISLGFADFGAGSGPIFMSNVACTGGESTILACPLGGHGFCSHDRDAGVICNGKYDPASDQQANHTNLHLHGNQPQLHAWSEICYSHACI